LEKKKIQRIYTEKMSFAASSNDVVRGSDVGVKEIFPTFGRMATALGEARVCVLGFHGNKDVLGQCHDLFPVGRGTGRNFRVLAMPVA